MADKEKDKKVFIEEDYGLKFKPLLNKIKERARRVTRRKEKGIVNRKSGSSMAIREDGNVNVVSNKNTQYKLKSDGKTAEAAHLSETIANRRKITADDVIINNHKLNPKLYEFTDFKSVYNDKNKVVGNLNMFGTVLVKAWEPTLEKYVLIRRLASMPIFSPELNTPEIHPDLSIESDLEKEFKEMVEVEKMADMISDFNKEKEGDKK